MVIAHLLIVNYALVEVQVRQIQLCYGIRLDRPEFVEYPGYLRLDVRGQITTVSSGIRDVLALIYILSSFQGLFRRHPPALVHISLQLCEIIKKRWVKILFLFLYINDLQVMACNLLNQAIDLFLLQDLAITMFEDGFSVLGVQFPVIGRLKLLDFSVTPDDHCKHRCLNPPYTPQLTLRTVFNRKESC